MKKINLFLITLIISGALFITQGYAEVNNFAVIDYQKALQSSKAFKSFQTQAQKIGESISKEIEKEKNDLEKSRADLINQSKDLSQNEIDRRKNDLDKRVEAFSKKYQTKQQNFDKIAADIITSIENQVQKIIDGIVAEKGYKLVYQSLALSYYPKDTDITAEVTKRLDKALPSVTVKNP